MLDSLLVQQMAETPALGCSVAKAFLPYFLVFHTKIDKCLRCPVPDAGDDFLINFHSYGFKIPHFAVQAGYKLTIYNLGFWKAFFNQRL